MVEHGIVHPGLPRFDPDATGVIWSDAFNQSMILKQPNRSTKQPPNQPTDQQQEIGWWFQPVRKKLSVGSIIPIYMENEKCSKPTTREIIN